jgi:hypothetical protein
VAVWLNGEVGGGPTISRKMINANWKKVVASQTCAIATQAELLRSRAPMSFSGAVKACARRLRSRTVYQIPARRMAATMKTKYAMNWAGSWEM